MVLIIIIVNNNTLTINTKNESKENYQNSDGKKETDKN